MFWLFCAIISISVQRSPEALVVEASKLSLQLPVVDSTFKFEILLFTAGWIFKSFPAIEVITAASPLAAANSVIPLFGWIFKSCEFEPVVIVGEIVLFPCSVTILLDGAIVKSPPLVAIVRLPFITTFPAVPSVPPAFAFVAVPGTNSISPPSYPSLFPVPPSFPLADPASNISLFPAPLLVSFFSDPLHPPS